MRIFLENFILYFSNMIHELPKLPYDLDALSPYISRETLEYHYGKHHKAYVDKLNELIVGTEFEPLSLVEIVNRAPKGPIFNNAAQIVNHTFYFETFTAPDTVGPLSGDLLSLMDAQWGSHEKFVADFTAKAIGNFGSGWTWLAKKSD